jgi:hypothetical protein
MVAGAKHKIFSKKLKYMYIVYRLPNIMIAVSSPPISNQQIRGRK